MWNAAGMHAENQNQKCHLTCYFFFFRSSLNCFTKMAHIFLVVKKLTTSAAAVTITTGIDLRFIFIILGILKRMRRNIITHFVYLLSSSGFRWISVFFQVFKTATRDGKKWSSNIGITISIAKVKFILLHFFASSPSSCLLSAQRESEKKAHQCKFPI